MKISKYSVLISLLLITACLKVENKKITYVSDSAGILTTDQRNKLASELQELRTSIGSQLAILIIDSLGGETIEEYSLRTAQEWKLGRKDYNDGILITASIKDRKMRIEVGSGLENILRDEIAAKIIREDMVADFKQEHYYEGLLKAVQHIKTLLSNNEKLIGVPYNQAWKS